MNLKKLLIIALLSLSLVNGAFAKVTDDTIRRYQEAMLYFENDDYEKAFPLLKESAEEGLPIAQALLGALYADGNGVKQDFKKALYWIEKGAKQEDTLALHLLGMMYAAGDGVKPNVEKAKGYFRLACNKGKQESCEALKDPVNYGRF